MPLSEIQKETDRVRAWINKCLQDVETLLFIPFRILLMIVIIDSFAQQDAGYGMKNNLKCFTDFVVKFGGELKDILEEVCPVTLYYHNCDKENLGNLNLPEHRILSVGDPDLQKESVRILSLLPTTKERESACTKHKYAGLINALRNKIVHELNYLNQQPNFQEHNEMQIPHVATRARKRPDNDSAECLNFDAWTVHIPISFIERVLYETTENYFHYCLNNSIMPFGSTATKGNACALVV
ncbi:MAG: hypothetical protein GX567_04400 [Clostridia bacterium]|nr:hypothetical protein [Clostridia bacterium]